MALNKIIIDAEDNWPEDEASLINSDITDAIEAGYGVEEIESKIIDLPYWEKVFEDRELFNRFKNALTWDFESKENSIEPWGEQDGEKQR